MIVTVTPNAALDKTVVVPGFSVGQTNRGAIDRIEVGGKGINVARTLRELGCPVVATGFLAGDGGREIAALLGQQGIDTDFVVVPGETRVNLKIVDPLAGLETEINEPGCEIPADALVALAARLKALARRAALMVFAGSLPPGLPADTYARFIRLAREEGVPTVLDAAGAALKHGIAAGPDLVKPNRAEVEELLGIGLVDDDALASAVRRLLAMGARSLVISLGAKGALSASPAGAWRARSAALAARNTVGAGDAMVAALACALTRAVTPPEALRLAVAAGAAVAAGVHRFPTLGQIDALVPQVIVEPATDYDATATSPRAAGAPGI